MKKKVAIILGVLVFITIAWLLVTGFHKRDDVVMADYSVSEDETELYLKVSVMGSMGYVREFADKGGGVKPQNEMSGLGEIPGKSDTPESKEEESQEDSSITEPLTSAEVDELIASIEEYGDSSVYATLYELRTIPENPVNPEGDWNRTNVHSGLWGKLSISEVTKEGFQVVGDLEYFSHSGSFEQTAYYITDNLAIAKYEEFFAEYEPQYVAFFLNGTSIDVIATASSADLGFGANVSIDGEYVQEEPTYTNANVLEEFYSQKDLDALQELLPEEYYTDYFLFATTEGMINEYNEQIYNDVAVRCIETYTITMGNYGYRLYIYADGNYVIKFEDGSVFATESNLIME